MPGALQRKHRGKNLPGWWEVDKHDQELLQLVHARGYYGGKASRRADAERLLLDLSTSFPQHFRVRASQGSSGKFHMVTGKMHV